MKLFLSWLLEKKSARFLLTLYIILAFAAMVISSYVFVSRIIGAHLAMDANNEMDKAQLMIEAELAKSSRTLRVLTPGLRRMLMDSSGAEESQAYFLETGKDLNDSEEFAGGFSGIYGYFDAFDTYLDSAEWVPPDGYISQQRPWYITAVEAGGSIVESTPYLDAQTGETIISHSQQLLDDSGNQLGVVSTDTTLTELVNYVANMHTAKGGYGFLTDRDLQIIAHPDPSWLGRSLYDPNASISGLADMIKQGGDLIKVNAVNYQGDNAIYYSRLLANGWHVFIVTPVSNYYHEMTILMVFLITLGIILAGILSLIVLYIADKQQKSDMESRQKSNFLATMSHEIRTPMNAILGVTEIQLQDEDLPPLNKEAFYTIYNSGYALLRIINDILDLSKIEAGKLELRSAVYDVASMINDTIHLNLMLIGSKTIKFEININESIPSELIGDELRIKQILNNLLSNAFKYTDKGTVMLSVSSQEDSDDIVTLVFSVFDTGIGMSPEQLDRLFDAYTRFVDDDSHKRIGTGLGMNITRNLINMMDGKITVQSELDMGSVFTVNLPQKSVGANPLGNEAAENLRKLRLGASAAAAGRSQVSRVPMPYGKVLIVDDVESNLFVAKGLMTPYELTIDTADEGESAIRRIENGNIYDVIFMDHMMPGMDGVETVKRIRDMGYTYPIVALTANAIVGQAEMFLQNGFDDFISKPIDIRQLNMVLNRLVRDKQPPEVLAEAGKYKNATESRPAALDEDLKAAFLRDAAKAVAAVTAFCDKPDHHTHDDINLYITNVHGIKSALANIGEHTLAELALRLENAGRNHNIPMILGDSPALLRALHSITERIGAKSDSDDADAGNAMFLAEKLALIREACQAYNKKAAKAALAELKQKAWPDETLQALNNMSEHLLHSDFDEVEAIASSLVTE